MKIITTLITLLLAIIATNAQSQFPGTHPEFLLNKEVKIKQFSDKYTIYNFHKDENMLLGGLEIPDLEGKTFTVISVDPYNPLGDKLFKIKLQNPENDIVYYRYNPEYPENYMLNTEGGITFPDGIFCNEISVKTDTYTGNITSNSPVLKETGFTKVVRKDKTTIYISAQVTGKDIQLKKTGLTIFLANGQKIEKPAAPINVKVDSTNGYNYTVFETLTTKDISLLLESEITKIKIYTYDKVIPDGNVLKEYLKCITKK